MVFLVLFLALSSTIDRGPQTGYNPRIKIVPTISPSPVDAAEASWQVPECPFAIEWSAAVLEEIRLAVVEAFFSLPHGGAEIGGVLFGTQDGGCVRILASRSLECEHALGPTFTLSENDHARLGALLAESGHDLRAQGLEPVGWYHSHTRSEIFLSAQDVAVHNRYFPDPWHVALVLRPHALKPVRAGFFFREAGGYMHVDSSYREFLLQPSAIGPPRPVEQPAFDPTGMGPVKTSSAARRSTDPAQIPVPAFLAVTPRRRYRRGLRWAAMAAIVLALGTGLFTFRKDLTPHLLYREAPSLSLTAYDLEGQVQIHWDRSAEPIRSAAAGTLEITDGARHSVVALDRGMLQRGTVGYARQTARVDVRLTVGGPDGKKFEELASFLGGAAATKPATDPSGDTETLRKELHDQTIRTRRLERAIGEMRAEIRREQERRRSAGQSQPIP